MEQTNKIGRRKTSVARVYLKSGKGIIQINDRKLEDYFPSEILQTIVKQPLEIVNATASYDFNINVEGGGFKGQAEAVRLGIARVLCEENPDNRPPLKKAGFLTRDPRMVERKKYGRRKARKRFQFSKR
ncbi:MAG TPA: 30S ribosomal protein S9 [Cyclobacteriaceae bacterium]|jgi:small subunit ribosomal protein S9